MTEKIFFYNQQETEPSGRIANRSLYYGEGVFETFRYKKELPTYFDRHLQRLKIGCEYLHLPLPDDNSLCDFIIGCLREANLDDAYVKLAVLSSGSNTFYDYPGSSVISILVKEYPTGPSNIKLATASEIKDSNNKLHSHKTTNYLGSIISKRKAQECGFDEALFLNEKGHVTEGTAYNIFWLKNDTLYTPSVENGLLPGITRSIVIEAAKDIKLKVLEGDFMQSQLKSTDLIFLSNALSGVITVSQFEDIALNTSSSKYEQLKENLLTRLKWD